MADSDPKPPSVSGISPQIKSPPSPGETTGHVAGLPPNLPTGKQPSVLPTPSRTSSFQADNELTSSIRTMESDLLAVKKGEVPVGSILEKAPEPPKPSSPQISAQPARPTVLTPPAFIAKLEPPVKSATIKTDSTKIPLPLNPPQPAQVQLKPAVPRLGVPSSSSSPIAKYVIAGIVLILVVGFSVWFFALRGGESQVAETPQETITVSSTPPVLLENFFSDVGAINIARSKDFLGRFRNLAEEQVAGSIENQVSIHRVQDGQERFGFSDFLEAAEISLPDSLASSTDGINFYVSLFKQITGGESQGLIVGLSDSVRARQGMTDWEPSLSRDLDDLFRLDLTKAASGSLLDNTYQGVAVRYRNFPDANSTIDYAIIEAASGDSYLIITSSRDHIYSIIDSLLTLP